MNKQIVALPLDLVIVGERLRTVDEDYVALIAASMQEKGQQTPIQVGPADTDGRHRLIAGGHRMAAARMAGLATIDAIISEVTGLEADLLEIDENLMRRELSALDRAVFLARRKDVYEALHPQTAHGKAKKGKDLEKSTSLSTFAERFTAATAAKLGVDERTIQRAVARAAIHPEVRAMIATLPIAESGAELDKLAALSPADQFEVGEALTRGEKPARSVSAALVEIKGPPSTSRAAETNRQYQALLSAWKKAGRAARRQFLDHLEREGEVALPQQEKRA